jgi:hypothetical protein
MTIQMVNTNTISTDEAELIQVLTMMAKYLIDLNQVSVNQNQSETVNSVSLFNSKTAEAEGGNRKND